ncbi:hypothetical protein L1049_017080 [Liquidambar formosana]|uniref:Protein ARV n=1 Tax=Liquidambar formosana TaxID=63359 RepID=A0AAP0S7B0_LIQFO
MKVSRHTPLTWHENCKAVADEYVECEIMILLIDLILHKPKAYRHLLYNMPNRDSVSFKGLLWKSTFGFLLLDAYMILVLKRSGEEWSLYTNFSSLLWRCGKILMDVFIGNFMFLCTILLAKRILLDTSGRVSRYKDLVLAILFSSYFKIFLIPMMVWEFPFSVIFIIDVFVLSSNTVALKVTTETAMNRCIGVCFSAYVVKFFADQVFDVHLPRF